MKRIIVLLLAIFLYFTLFGRDVISGRVKAVIDGNTLEVELGNQEIQVIQLAGIDSPELGQDYGDDAKTHLEKLVLQKSVEINVVGKDRWGKPQATVMMNGLDIRMELLKEGLAWTAERNPLPELESVKEHARKNTKGLWKQDNPTPPWIYRRQQTMEQVKGS